VHGRVEQHHAGEQLGVVDGPAERNEAAPVVPEGEHGTLEAEGVGQGSQVAHALGERTVHTGALREAHVELVDGDHAPGGGPLGGIRCGAGDEVAPQVRPGRVAVHTQDGADGLRAEFGELGAVVEQVPGAGDGDAVSDIHLPRRV
jgi:hypothetical protein